MRPVPDNPRRILFIKLSSLGDVLLSTPALAAVRAHWPAAQITYLVEPEGAVLVRGNPDVDRVVCFDRRAAERLLPWRPFAARRVLRETARELAALDFDLALDFQGLAKSWYFLRASRARFTAGKGRFPGVDLVSPHRRGSARHAVPSYFELTDLLGIPRPDEALMRPRVPVSVDDEAAADEWLAARGLARGGYAVLNPFTTWSSKRWLDERWAALGRALAARGLAVVVAGAPGDLAASTALAARIGPAATSAAGAFALTGFAALLSRAACFVSVDSFPLHLAAALRVPTVACYGPTDPVRTGPWQGRVTVLEHGCRKGHCLRRGCRTPEACMGAIRHDEVLSALEQLGVLPG